MGEEEAAPAGAKPSRAKRAWVAVLRYLGAYLLGIGVCVAVTPVEISLGGLVLVPFYLLLGVVGFVLFYVYLDGAYLPHGGSGVAYWVMYCVGVLPVVLGAADLLGVRRLRRLRRWRPLWTGFPVGFVGTLGVYYTAAASI